MSGEISFNKLFRLIDSEIDNKAQRICESLLPDYQSYLKEFGALSTLRSLRGIFKDLADKQLAQDEED